MKKTSDSVLITVIFACLCIALTRGQWPGFNNVCTVSATRTTCTTVWLLFSECSTVYYAQGYCCDGWTTDNFISCDIPWCVGGWSTCPNGGTCSSAYHCDCTDNYYSPDCELCTRINNCVDGYYYCTTASDQVCRRCEYTMGNQERAYSIQGQQCTQLCSWRPDSKQCFPGACTDSLGTPGSCQCASGFSSSSSDCMTITDTPDFLYCLATASHRSGINEIEYVDTACSDETNPTTYTNYEDFNYVRVNWNSQFVGPSPSRPYYINDFQVGVTNAQVLWYHKRGGSTITSGTISCNSGYSQSNPNLGINACTNGGSISTSWSHEDVLEINLASTNGGYLKINNYDSGLPGTVDTQYYTGSTRTHYSTITFDFVPPVHCAVTSSCGDNMLDVGAPYRTSATTEVGWYGWTDPLSGVGEYAIEVYRLSPLGETLGYAASAPLWQATYSSLPGSLPQYTFPAPGVYCFLLTVLDVAGNFRYARRFVLFDDENVVEISDLEADSVVMVSAASNTDFTWQTNLDQLVEVEWHGHFYNEEHTVSKFLAAIVDHHVTIESGYEENTGQPHSFRSEEAIPHVNGIVKYEMAYAVDHEGGRTITNLNDDDLFNIDAFQSEEHELSITREDGDSMRIWIKAFDVVNNTATESILVHVDSTPAEIDMQGLVKDEEYLLAVHSLLELYDLSFEFEVADYHSGLREVYWELHDMADSSTVHGSGQLPASQVPCDTCTTEHCYQIPKDNECYDKHFTLEPDSSLFDIEVGSHDYDYVFRVIVTNNAMLVSSADFQITVDVSPPEPGVVSDAEPGQMDKDFQSASTVHASWSGFFDEESGIKKYELMFGTACKTADDFVDETDTIYSTTTDTFYSFENIAAGTYFTTVIAYNHAMDPSRPACSDGVTIDDSAPIVEHVLIDGLSIEGGFIGDAAGDIAYLDEDGYRHVVADPASCQGDSMLVDDLEVYPPYMVSSRAYVEPDCSSMQAPGEYMFLPQQYKLNVTWVGSDNESSPMYYEVCLGSSSGGSDVMPCTSADGHDTFLTYHLNIESLQTFYLHISAVNKAGLETTKTLGPIAVKNSGPEAVEDFSLDLETSSDDEYLHLTWTYGDDYQSEMESAFLKSVSYALGETDCKPNHVEFTPLTDTFYTSSPLGCLWQDPPDCLAIAVDDLSLHLHGGQSYCAVLKLEGRNGFATYVTADYQYHFGTPAVGSVVEIDIDNGVMEDIDYQTSSTNIKIYYQDSDINEDSNIQLGAAITQDTSSLDTLSYTDLDYYVNTYMFTGLNLENYETYYVVLRTSDTDTGLTSYSTSDGITALPPSGTAINVDVIDNKPCSDSDSLAIDDDTYHVDQREEPMCGVDIDFQAMTSTFDAHWSIPSTITPFVMAQNVMLMVEHNDGSSVQANPTLDAGLKSSISITGIALEPGKRYYVSVTICHPVACYQAVSSDGVVILPDPPVAQPITAASLDATGSAVTLSWPPFRDMYVSGSDFMERYEFAIYVQHKNNDEEFILDWVTLTSNEITSQSGSSISATVTLDHQIIETSCIMVAIRGYSSTGLHATSAEELTDCSELNPHRTIVYDAHGHINEDGDVVDITFDSTTTYWTDPEREFTSSTANISAIWPSLRHGQFDWKVLSEASIQAWAYFRESDTLTYDDFHCSSPEVLACGSTEDRWINVHDLDLSDGDRYFTCVHADAVTLTHELWDEPLDEVSACSNGIVVDTQDPIAGDVWIGNYWYHHMFHTDASTVVIQWHGFLDAEVYADTKHDTGIQYYLVALGTEPRGHDVVDFVNVGITNYHRVSGLRLEEGRPYFATVTAVDYVYHETAASSQAMLVDSSPPTYVENTISLDSIFLTPQQDIFFSWVETFYDKQSGISNYVWCIGTIPGICDTTSGTEITNAYYVLPFDSDLFMDGRHYYFNLQAINGAGLVSYASSSAFTVDGSGPQGGYVWETAEGASETDIDYQSEKDSLYLVWGGFYDPDVQIKEYKLKVGTCADCSDVITEINMGLRTDISLNHLTLKEGVRYYTTISACSVTELCGSVSSDGVLIDSKPPHVAQILDGLQAGDSDYQSSRSMVSFRMTNMHDVGSGLKHVTVWCTTQDAGHVHTEVTPPLVLHPHAVITFTPSPQLPEAQRVFVNVELCDNVGLCTLKRSNGFVVDTSSPVQQTPVSVSNNGGSVVDDSQVWTSALTVAWAAVDDVSPVSHSILSLTTDRNSDEPFPRLTLYGEHREHTFTDIGAEDGDHVVVSVQTCNHADLCVTAQSLETLIDSSPPLAGAFAVITDHSMNSTLQVSRSAADHMTYSPLAVSNPAQIHLSWIGFHDPHSDIVEYVITLGRSYRGSELLQNDEVTVDHDTAESRLEGYLQTASIDVVGDISHNEQLYITIQAVNGVGLKSRVIHGLFEAIPSGSGGGSLHLVRRCETETCESHCTCAPHALIHCNVASTVCTDTDGDVSYADVSVFDVYPSDVENSAAADIDHSVSTDSLSARWTVASSGMQPLWFEWSVGIEGNSPGNGLLNQLTQPLWFDNMKKQHAVYTTPMSHIQDLSLETSITYVFYVKVWYTSTDYRVVVSDGVQIDSTPPQISSTYKVIEVASSDSNEDIDYTMDPDAIHIDWSNIFFDSDSDLESFTVCIGNEKGQCDVAEEVVMDGMATQVEMTTLSLETFVAYHTSVTACNVAKLCSVSHSDGFKVDNTAADIGLIEDGSGLHDVIYSSDTNSVSAFWHGFYDDGSYITGYNVCFTLDPASGTNLACQDTKMNRATISLDTAIHHDAMVYATVLAINGVDLESERSISNGVLIDTSPPQSFERFETGENIVDNPSYEEDISGTWSTTNDQFTMETDAPHDELGYICLNDNAVSQTLTTEADVTYQLSFAAKRGSSDTITPTITCFLRAGLSHELFILTDVTNQNDSFHAEWIYHHMYFLAVSTQTLLTFGTEDNDIGVCFDSVLVQAISSTDDAGSGESGAIHVKLRTSPESTDLVASWHMQDPQSAVVETLVALGTVAGGVQIANFESVGHHNTYRKSGLRLQHGTELHTTLKVTNGAGLYSVFHADPVTVDITPPVILSFEVNSGNTAMTTLSASVSWETEDAESGIETCWLSASTIDTAVTLINTTSVSSSGSYSGSLSDDVMHGDMVQFLLRCKSNIGLVTSAASQPITMILEAPDVDAASISIIHEPASMYPERGNYVSNVENLWVKWNDVSNNASIEHCEMNFGDLTDNALTWSDLGFDQRRFLEITNLDLAQGSTYTLELKCENMGGFTSDVITTTFTVDSTTPVYSGETLTHEWVSENTLLISWTDLFSGASSLLYQVHAGTVEGGADILKWAETSGTSMEITGLDNSLTYHVSVVAINMAGLYTSHNFVIA